MGEVRGRRRGRLRRRLRRADDRRRRGRVAAEHPRLARLPAARAARRGQLGLPVHVDNDAKALALGEGWIGAAAGERDFIAMVVSTGVGGGIVLDGRLLDGADGNAGHIGHVDRRARRPAVRLRRARLPRGRGVGHGHRRPHRPAGRRGRRRERARAGQLVGRAVARSPPCSTCGSPWSPARSRSASATPFFAAAQAELDRSARIDFAAGPAILPAGLGADGPLVGAAAVGAAGAGPPGPAPWVASAP